MLGALHMSLRGAVIVIRAMAIILHYRAGRMAVMLMVVAAAQSDYRDEAQHGKR